MRLFDKVAIVGTGLIGGSIALAIKRKGLANEVIGVSRHKQTLSKALQNRAIDKGSTNINVIRGADLVILATPVRAVLNLAPLVRKITNPDCIVTDVASTKQEIAAKLGKIFPNYIGSHPLAGSERRGIINADAGLFKDSLCILTPAQNTDKKNLSRIKKFWGCLGARVINLSPAEHDKILSLVSHLTHIAAFSLINSVPRKYLRFASSGLKGTTRIAASDSGLWSDIFLSNQKNMLVSISSFQKNISKIKSAIQRKDRKVLTLILREAAAKRELLG